MEPSRLSNSQFYPLDVDDTLMAPCGNIASWPGIFSSNLEVEQKLEKNTILLVILAVT